MKEYIIKVFLSEKKISSNIYWIVFSAILSWSAYKKGINAKISLWLVIPISCLFWMRGISSIYCLIKFRKVNNEFKNNYKY